jgi:nucleoside-diphosphate-sugar epimerase
MRIWWNLLVAPLPDSLDAQLFINSNAAWIDVRDIADAHVASIEKEAAGGERMIVTAGEFLWHDWSAYLPLSIMNLEFLR